MSQWMTSGASRLRAKQKRTFAARAQQRAAVASAVRNGTAVHSSLSRVPGRRSGGNVRRMKVGETVTTKSSRSMYRTGTTQEPITDIHPQMSRPVLPHNHHESFPAQGHPVVRQNTRTRNPPSNNVTMLSSSIRQPNRRSIVNSRPSSAENPFEAALQAANDTRLAMMQPEQMPLSFVGSRTFRRQMPLSPATLSIKGDRIMRLLAANQSGSIASPSSVSQAATQIMTTTRQLDNPFDMPPPSRNVGRNSIGGLSLSSQKRRGIARFAPRRMSPEETLGEFLLDSPTSVNAPETLCFRQSPTRSTDGFYRAGASRGLKRSSSASSYNSDSSSDSRKQARRLNVMNVSVPNTDGLGSQRLFVGVDMSEPGGGFDRFRNRRSLDKDNQQQQQQQGTSITSNEAPPAAESTRPDKIPDAPALRYFNNGVEVDMYGRPLDKQPSVEEQSQSTPEPEVDLDTLKDHQKAVWDQFSESPDQAKERQRKQSRKKSTSRKPKETPPAVNLEIDPTPSALSSDPDKLATADVDDLIRDSLKEREKTLSAASVLMGFLGQQDTKSAVACTQTAQV